MKKLKVLALIILAIFAAGLCACGGSGGVPSGYDVTVTYYFNGGNMTLYTNLTELTVRYRKGSLIAEPGVSTNQLPDVKKSGYSPAGWYFAETDAEGVLVKDENGNPKPSDRRFDFSKDRVDADVTIVIIWSGKIRVYVENLYIMAGLKYQADYESGDSFTDPGLEYSVVESGESKKVVGYYWSYDKATDTYSDPIDFSVGLTFDDLKAHLADEPEKEGEYPILRIYAKLAD